MAAISDFVSIGYMFWPGRSKFMNILLLKNSTYRIRITIYRICYEKLDPERFKISQLYCLFRIFVQNPPTLLLAVTIPFFYGVNMASHACSILTNFII